MGELCGECGHAGHGGECREPVAELDGVPCGCPGWLTLWGAAAEGAGLSGAEPLGSRAEIEAARRGRG